MTRDPGDDLWAQTFERLAPEPSLGHLNANTKGDFLELTLAAQVLDCAEKPCSEPLMRCLHAARLLIEDAARTLEELQLWGNPLLLRVTREIHGCRVSCKSCPKCGGAVFGQWRYATWGGLLAAVGAHLGLVSSACWSTVGSAFCPYLQQVTSTQSRRSMNGRVFSSPVAGFSMTHISGSKCAMISKALIALLESSRAHRQSSAVLRAGWPRPGQSAPAETARSSSSGCRTGSWAQISTRCPGRRPSTQPPRRLGQSTLCRKTAPVLACLTITPAQQSTHRQGRGSSSFACSDQSFFNRRQKRMTEPLFWQCEVAGNPMGAQGLLRGAAPQRELCNRRQALEALLEAGRDRSGRVSKKIQNGHPRPGAPQAEACAEGR